MHVQARALLLLIVVVCPGFAAGCERRDPREAPSPVERLEGAATEALRRGDLAQALTFADAGIAEADRRRSADAAIRFRLLKTEVLLHRRDAPAAAALLLQPIPDTPGHAASMARRRQLQGHLHLVEGRFEEALEGFADAATLARTAGAADVRLDAEIFEGQVLLRMGRADDAEPILQRAVSDAEAAGDRFRQVLALHNLGMGRLVRGLFDEAVRYFDRVLEFRDMEGYAVHATALTNAATCYARLGEFDRAVAALDIAVATHERLNARVYLEQALGERGSTFVLMGDYDRAIASLSRALEEARTAGQEADAALWAANLASAYLEQGRWDDAERLSVEARRLGGEDRNQAYFTLFEARILEGRGRLDEAARAYREASTLGRDVPNVQWRVAARLGWIAHLTGQPEAAAAHFEQALAIVERNRASLRDEDFRLSIQARGIDLYHQYVDVLLEQGQVERALAVADSGRAAVLSERYGGSARPRAEPAALRRLTRHLGAVALFYWFGQSRSHVWVVTPERIRLVPLSAAAGEIDALVADYRRLVVDGLGDPLRMSDSAGDRLYEALIDPVAEWIPSGSRVIVVPDGSLGTLNLEALPVAGNRRHFWIEDVEVAVAPSLGMLLDAPRTAAAASRDSLLLIGDAVEADPRFPALTYAGTEMRAIASAFGARATVYRGKEASPAAYQAAGPGAFGIVHFTAHALANATSPLDSAVILSPGPSGYKLYARDVAQRPLTAGLVTISACRSAGERTYAGEGLVGFAWAFLRAGAKRVIAGLWDVDDRSTADLMTRLYAGIARGDTPGTALRAAKLALLAGGTAAAKPYYWAPFQVFIGTGDPP
jgi:CHAT domain-containing protein/tetratricopeptide (TPR) repeat protein